MLQRQNVWVPMTRHNTLFRDGVERFLRNNPISTLVSSSLRLEPENMFAALEPDPRAEKPVARLLAVPFVVPKYVCDPAEGSQLPAVNTGFLNNVADSLNSLHVMERLLPRLSIHVSICLQLQQVQPLHEGDRVIIISSLDKIGKRIAYCKTDFYVDQDESPKGVRAAERSIDSIDSLQHVLNHYRKVASGSHVKSILERVKAEATATTA